MLASLVVLVLLAGEVLAAGWGGIVPGQTTRAEVERQYGPPSRERALAEQGRTGREWTYTGERVPQGLDRMVVGFGLIVSGQFDPLKVRELTLYPKPRVFTLDMVMAGWGKPDAIGTEVEQGRPALRYQGQAILVVLDPTGRWAEMLLFAPAQPAGPSRP